MALVALSDEAGRWNRGAFCTSLTLLAEHLLEVRRCRFRDAHPRVLARARTASETVPKLAILGDGALAVGRASDVGLLTSARIQVAVGK